MIELELTETLEVKLIESRIDELENWLNIHDGPQYKTGELHVNRRMVAYAVDILNGLLDDIAIAQNRKEN